ncbi:MAG: glutathione transferase GstA [Rickettsiales bacterium]|nr:glutathione transferase GstA [Rickettsiales bacterium]
MSFNRKKLVSNFVILGIVFAFCMAVKNQHDARKKNARITLYYSKGSSSLADRIIINELGIDATYVSVDLKTKKTENGEDYFNINKLGYVPALKLDNGAILTENIAIIQYLAEQYGDGKMIGGGFERYRVMEKMSFIASELHKTFGALFKQTDAKEKAKTMKDLKPKLEYVDKVLGESKFIAGNYFSIADAYAFVILNFANFVNVDLKSYKNITAYMKEIGTREAVIKSLRQEGLIK